MSSHVSMSLFSFVCLFLCSFTCLIRASFIDAFLIGRPLQDASIWYLPALLKFISLGSAAALNATMVADPPNRPLLPGTHLLF